jgi:hypothetical protein
MLLSSFLVLLVTFVAGGIYPDGHWSRSTKLTVQNFDDEVKKNIDADKTFFVRWIASEG